MGFGQFLRDNDISAESFVRHIHYVAELVGPEHVGIGLDFVYYPEQFYREVMVDPGWWPKEYLQNLDGFRYFPLEELPRVTEVLMRRSYSENEIRGILGENFLRVAKQHLGLGDYQMRSLQGIVRHLYTVMIACILLAQLKLSLTEAKTCQTVGKLCLYVRQLVYRNRLRTIFKYSRTKEDRMWLTEQLLTN